MCFAFVLTRKQIRVEFSRFAQIMKQKWLEFFKTFILADGNECAATTKMNAVMTITNLFYLLHFLWFIIILFCYCMVKQLFLRISVSNFSVCFMLCYSIGCRDSNSFRWISRRQGTSITRIFLNFCEKFLLQFCNSNM